MKWKSLSCVRFSVTSWTVLCPWYSPGKNTGMGCYFLLQVFFFFFSVLPRKCTGHSKHPLPTIHMDIIRWSTPKSDWLYSLQPKMEKLYTVNKNRTRSWLWLRSWTPYCQIQTEIEENRENIIDHSGMTLIKSLMIIQWKWEIDLRA